MMQTLFGGFKTIAFLGLLLISQLAFAESAAMSSLATGLDVLEFNAGVSTRYDDNLFRQASNVQESDIINRLSLGVKVDAQYSLQRIRLNASITRNRYRTNDRLDWDNKNYGASWSWAITPRLTGTLAANRSEQAVNFNDFLVNNIDPSSIQQIIQTSRNESLLFDYNVFGGWHVRGGASKQSQENSQSFEQNPTFTTKSVDLGVRYDFRSGSQLTVMNHTRRGDNDDRTVSLTFDNKFKENETELVLNWLLSAKSTVRTTLGYYKREHDTLSVWDYSGFQGGVAYQWTPTGKLAVNVDLSSRLGTFQLIDDLGNVDASHARTTTFSIRPVYQYSSKIRFTSNFSYSKRKFEGDENPAVNSANSRQEDDNYSIGVGMGWQPLSNTSLGLNFSQQKNDSNNDLFDYKAKSATLSGNITF